MFFRTLNFSFRYCSSGLRSRARKHILLNDRWHLQMRKYRFSSRFQDSAGEVLRFHDRGDALRFLRKLAPDFDMLSELRRWGNDSIHKPRSDKSLLHFASASLVSGELTVWYLDRVTRGGGGGTPADTAKPEVPARAQRNPRERVTPSAMREPPQEPWTQSAAVPVPEVDVAQQVATLLAAAQNGTPFCEQCERAKREAVQ